MNIKILLINIATIIINLLLVFYVILAVTTINLLLFMLGFVLGVAAICYVTLKIQKRDMTYFKTKYIKNECKFDKKKAMGLLIIFLFFLVLLVLLEPYAVFVGITLGIMFSAYFILATPDLVYVCFSYREMLGSQLMKHKIFKNLK